MSLLRYADAVRLWGRCVIPAVVFGGVPKHFLVVTGVCPKVPKIGGFGFQEEKLCFVLGVVDFDPRLNPVHEALT